MRLHTSWTRHWGPIILESYDAIIDAGCDAWRRLLAQPETVSSIEMRYWAHIGQPKNRS
jgi:hypothetical protein